MRSLRRRLGPAGAALIMACVGPLACGPREDVQEEPAVAEAPPDSQPPPVSVRVEPPVSEPQADPIDRIRRRFAEIGAASLLVVRGRVTNAVVAERVLPQQLHWGAEAMPVTTIAIAISTTYCGTPTPSVRASYVGGRLPNGRLERTEQMPTDLAQDRDFVFFLRAVGNEYFLELGQEDLLQPAASGVYHDAARNSIPIASLRGICP